MTSEELDRIEAKWTATGREVAAYMGDHETFPGEIRDAENFRLIARVLLGESGDDADGRAMADAYADVPALVAEVRRLAALVAAAPGEEMEQCAWVRGFFNALAYHSEGVDREEGIASTGLLTEEEAIAAGAEPGDVEKMRPEFAMLQSIAADRERRRATRRTR